MQSVEKLCRENQSLARQIWERIKALLEVFGKSHSEREEIKKFRETERLFRAALETGGQDYIRGEMEEASGEATVHYSKSENSSIKEQLREHLDEVNAMEPVASVTYTPTTKKQVFENAMAEFKKIGFKVDRQGFGVIEIGEKQIRTSLNYLDEDAEIATLLSIPKVLKRGIDISGHENHKERGYSSITIAAPVEVNGKVGNVAAVVKQAGKNKYHTHRILMPDGSEFVFENKNNAELPIASMTSEENTRERLAISSASNTSISQNSEKSTPETKKSRKVQHSYAGKKSVAADTSLFERAEAMEAEGAESEAIRRETGWFKSFDGEWRFEIDDSKMRYLNPTLDAEGFTTLGELIEHEALFEAYPQLRDLKVEVKADTKYNYYSARLKKIVLQEAVFEDGDFKKSQDQKLSGKYILIHEIQHAIQHIEGFARGSSPSEWRGVIRERRKKVGSGIKEHTDRTIAWLAEKYGEEIGQDTERYIKLVLLDWKNKLNRSELEELDYLEVELEMMLGEDFERIENALIAEAKWIRSVKSIKGEAELSYYNTAGEIESYDVGDRVDLDAEVRRAVRPDIDRNPDDVKFADPNSWKKMHAEDVDIYTEEQYNNFGWAREAEAITQSELDDLYSTIKTIKLSNCPRSSMGEYIVEVNNKPHTTLDVNNVFVFFKGDKNNPQITRVIRAEIFSNTEMELYRNVVYGREKGITTAVSSYSYFEARGILQEYTRRDYADFDRYLQGSRGRTIGQSGSQGSGADRIRSNGTGSTQSGTGNAERYLKTVDTFYDVSGEKHEIVKFDGKYFIRGNDRGRPFDTIEAVIESKNNRVINRYSRILDKTVGSIKRQLEADPDFLKNGHKKIQYSRKSSDNNGGNAVSGAELMRRLDIGSDLSLSNVDSDARRQRNLLQGYKRHFKQWRFTYYIVNCFIPAPRQAPS